MKTAVFLVVTRCYMVVEERWFSGDGMKYPYLFQKIRYHIPEGKKCILRTSTTCWQNYIRRRFHKIAKKSISLIMYVRLSVCLSVCLSVRMEQLRSHWTDFHENASIFRKYVKRFKFRLNRTRITGTLHEGQHTFPSYFAQMFLE